MSKFGDNESEGTFAIFFAEGEVLAKQGQYQKAIESFTKALDLQPEDKSCFVARSKCYLQLGEAKFALKDAEESLKETKKYHKGLYQKAEALYSMGDFEYALVFYHRGHKIRPELHEFTLGIQKAQEAIDNSIGSPASCKLEKKGDLTFFKQQDTLAKKPKKFIKGQQQKTEKVERKPVASEKTTKELLGEMYSDKEYLEKLRKDPGLVIGLKDDTIYDTVENALSYLDARTEFWRQQKPMYARKREKEQKKYRPAVYKGKPKDGSLDADPTHYVLKALEEIDNGLANGNAEVSLQQAEKLMKTVKSLSDKDLPNKQEFIASLHSCIGNSYLELGEAETALVHHLQDMKISEDEDLHDIRGRALDNIGRVYSVLGEFEKAAEYWNMKLPLIKTAEESTWLYHELGRCNLELNNYKEARDLGEQSLTAAREAQDQMWQLNASVLIAQAKTKLGDLQAAVVQFEQSHDLATGLDDLASQQAIAKALEEINSQIVENLQPQDGSNSVSKSNTEIDPVN